MKWSDITESVIAGIVTAVVWAGILYGANLIRHRAIRRSLKKVFENPGTSTDIDGFGITVRNTSNVPVTVRKVQLFERDPEKSLSLNYSGPTGDVIAPPADLKERHETSVRRKRPFVEDERGFVKIEPQCGGIWSVGNQALLLAAPATISHIEAIGVVLDYANVLGAKTVLSVRAEERITKEINQAFLAHLEQVPRLAKLPPLPEY